MQITTNTITFIFSRQDIDGTILNFELAERAAIRSLFDRFKLGECSDEMLMYYSQINKRYWQLMESGKIKKDKISQ